MRRRKAEGGSRLLSCLKGNRAESRAAGAEQLHDAGLSGSGSGHSPQTSPTGNQTENRAAGTERLAPTKMFGRGGGHSLLWDAVCAACMALSLVIDMNLRGGNNYYNWYASIPDTLTVSAVTIGGYYILRRARQHLTDGGWGIRLFSLFLGAWWVMARSVRGTLDINQPFLTHGQMLKAAVVALGMACIWDLFLRALRDVLCGRYTLRLDGAASLRVMKLYRAHPMAVCAAAVLLMWLPQYVFAYPGAVNFDTASQLHQALGWEVWDDKHPLIMTLLIDALVRFGRLVGSGNAAFVLYTALQGVFSALVLGYCQAVMRRLGAPRWLRLGFLLLSGLGVVYCDNITVILKDVPYSYAVVLLLCELARLCLLGDEAEGLRPGTALRMALSGVVMIVFRNNGIGVLLAALAAWLWQLHRRGRRAMMLQAAAVLLLPVLLTQGVKTGIRASREVTPCSLGESLSFPLQQTARFVWAHPDEVTPQERAAIDAVLDYDQLADLYDPTVSDPVKATFRDDATREELLSYFGVWARQFLRDPACYVKATLIQNAPLFDPQFNNIIVFYPTGLTDEEEAALGIVEPDRTERMETVENQLHELLYGLPFYVQLNTFGFYSILLVGACLIARREWVNGLGAVTLPLLAAMVMVALGPCIECQDRYGFPIMYSMPLVLACLGFLLRQKQAMRADE